MKQIFYIFLALFFFSSCTINRNVMFKTDQDFEFDIPNALSPEYVISPNDRITLKVYANNGANLVNFSASAGGDQNMQNGLRSVDLSYLVEADGRVNLPEIGYVEVAGKTLFQAQEDIEVLFNEFHQKSYALIQIVNNRVIVFPGSGGDARVITLENNNTTLIESLALAGGIADRGDASKVKLIRKNGENENMIYEMDLSTIDGIQSAQMIVQANDIIYVEPVPEIASEALRDISPIVQLISSLAVLYAVFTNTLGPN